ncbi:MAG: pyruvate-ferredoxin/flavodoxin oxidoreductase, partial [bacterium]
MSESKYKTLDGNEAVGSIAYRVNEVIAIYPITPASSMGEWADAWAAEGNKNIWDTVPSVIEMQSEGGAVASVHGALQTGSLSCTFTASQGLLLMLPNMYKIAGELTPTVFHIAARSLATHALSIFGDHSDVMSARSTGFAMLCSASVQEAMDLALIAHSSTLESRIPFLHFFDGFRTSHEVSKVKTIDDDIIREMINDDKVLEHRSRALTPETPVIRGTAQNPDVFFQAREAANPFYDACPGNTQEAMDKFAKLTGRSYNLFDYYGHPEAEKIIILMGSGVETVKETVDSLEARGEKVGVIAIRLYRPFSIRHFVDSIPATVKIITVLDRCKEPGSGGDPLYLDCLQGLHEGIQKGWGGLNALPTMLAGRYGLSSKEFTPAMVKGIFDNAGQETPKNHFTIGINDDVGHSSLDYDSSFTTIPDDVVQALFYGLGSDGTVGANKNSIKIIGENTDNFAQGYFVYDSKKSGSVTVSHLRFGPNPIKAAYLITEANFVGCHQPIFLEQRNILEELVEGGIFLLNSIHSKDEVWNHLPKVFQEEIINKKIKFYVIDAQKVASETGMGRRINTIMQVCFFATSNVLPKDSAIEAIKVSIRKSYGKKGSSIVDTNIKAVDTTLSHLFEVTVPEVVNSAIAFKDAISGKAPEFVKSVLGQIIAGKGDDLPVSAFTSSVDGTFPTGTTKWEKRNIAFEIPEWDQDTCIQCGKCVMVCPHAVIRAKVYDEEHLKNAPETFKSKDARDKAWDGQKFTLQVAPEDCTGCGICVDVCPAKNKSETRLKAINMVPQVPIREQEIKNWDHFLEIPEVDRRDLNLSKISHQQLQEPLFEFSGACTGCGETPYVKLVSQLFGDRTVIANATGCSSIYGGNLPTTPWTKNKDGRGPAWANSLFEDNAEFGLGFRVSIDKQREFASELLVKVAGQVGDELANEILTADQSDESGIYDQRERVVILKEKLEEMVHPVTKQFTTPEAKQLLKLADVLVKKSVWIIGGDGWAYDIGYGGLDHVFASGRNVNILVLDTEVYSNTGGQTSKSTPIGAVAKFSAGGKLTNKKDLGLMAMNYGNVYVASVAMGSKDAHTLKAFMEAEAYDGPSLIIAYSHCIAHGINMSTAMQNQKAVVSSGQWILYRHHPDRKEKGLNPLQLDSRTSGFSLEKYLYMEN